MRIGLNALFFIPGGLAGIGVYTTNLLHHLALTAPQHEYILFVSRESRGFFANLPDCVRVIALPAPAGARPLRILAEQCLLPFYSRAESLDLLHSLAFTAPLFLACPSVVSILDVGFRYWRQRFSLLGILAHNALVPAVARRSSHIIAISHASKAEIASEMGVQPSRISVTHLACDHRRFRPLGSRGQDLDAGLVTRYGIQMPYILSIASSYAHKNLEGLVQAYALLIAEHQIHHQLLLVGHKRRAYPQLLELIDRLGLKDRVILTGFVPDDDLPLLYSFADLFVFPSFYEGFGMPPLEAMACGTPVVCSNATSLPEVVGDAAWLVQPQDVEAIAEGILHVLTDSNLRSDLMQRGLKRARQFTWEKTARETLAVYELVAEMR